MEKLIEKIKQNGLNGEITIPADKSISHRSLIFGALTNSKIKIKNLSLGADCISTLKILEKLGAKYEFISKKDLILDSSLMNGVFSIDENRPNGAVDDILDKNIISLDCGNSGTTTRLLAGLFARSNLKVELTGDSSLQKRPMKRIIDPLRQMGADIEAKDNKLPMIIKGKKLNPIEYSSPLSSAQVKSCLILAGLGIEGETVVYEPTLSRNHSEIMLKYLGADIETGKGEKGFFTRVKKSNLSPKDIEIAGDISSAAFFMVSAAIIPNSSILIKNVGINPTRMGILDVFKQSGVDFELLNKKTISLEEVCDIRVKYTKNLKPFEISGSLIPRLIDEIPILAVFASQIDGTSVVKDAQDLRNKESDRIKTIVETFEKLDIKIKENPDGFEITGQKGELNKKINLKTHLDHRLAMSYFVLALLNGKETKIEGFECCNTSFPEFLELFGALCV